MSAFQLFDVVAGILPSVLFFFNPEVDEDRMLISILPSPFIGFVRPQIFRDSPLHPPSLPFLLLWTLLQEEDAICRPISLALFFCLIPFS